MSPCESTHPNGMYWRAVGLAAQVTDANGWSPESALNQGTNSAEHRRDGIETHFDGYEDHGLATSATPLARRGATR